MSASSRKTYDTDSLVMRRIFAYDPFTNSPLSTNFILSADVKGVALFKSPLEVLSTFGWYDLPDQILSTQILTLSSISTTLGYLASTIEFFQPYIPSSQQIFLPSTVNGLGTMGYVSSSQLASTTNGLINSLASLNYVSSTQLTSTITGLGSSRYLSSTQLTSTVQGLGSAGYLSSGVILGPIVSTVTGLGSVGYVSSTQLASTVSGLVDSLGSFGYISTINTQSTITGLGTIGYVSSTQLISSLDGIGTLGYISSTQFASTIANLGSLNYISSASLYSTVREATVSTSVGLATLGYVSSTQLTSTVQGLGSAGFISSPVFLGISTTFISSALLVTSSISTFSLNLQELILGSNSFPFFFTSTVAGLGSASYVSSTQLTSSLTGLATIGYVSSTQLFSTVGGLGSASYVSSTQLTSSLVGLATIGYVSSTQLFSTVGGLGSIGYVSSTQIVSSLKGLATIGYVSSTQLFSTVGGLANIGYVSSTQLASTVTGLATSSYVSSTQLFSSVANFVSIRSTFNNSLTGNWSNINFLYQNLIAGCNLNIIRFDMGSTFRNKMLSGAATCKLDVETKVNLQFSYYDTNSRDYQFNTFLVRGSSFITSNIIGQESMTYYILNENPINLPFFFQEKNRFIITDPNVLSTLKFQSSFNTLSVFNTFGPNVPATNQLFASPASTACVSVVLDNLPTP